MSFKAAIFDLDGTLLDSMGMWASLCPKFLSRHGIKVGMEVNAKIGVPSVRGAIRWMLETYNIAADEDHMYAQVWDEITHFYSEEVSLKPGIMPILDKLRRSGIRAGLLTATENGLLKHALRRVGLADYFGSDIVSCAELNLSKATAEPFMLITEKLNSTPEETIVFEDAFYAAKTAKLNNFKVAAVYDLYEPHQDKLQNCANWYCRQWQDFPLEII